MVVGIGSDVVEIQRMERELARQGDGFRDDVFTAREQESARTQSRQARYFAGCFAAKEACMKALGTGWGSGVGWRDIELVRKDDGQAALRLSGKARDIACARGVTASFLSLAHTARLAFASVILETGHDPEHGGQGLT